MTTTLRPSAVDITAAYEAIVYSAIAIFNQDGYVQPQMFVFTLADAAEGDFANVGAVESGIVLRLYEGNAGKNSMQAMLTRIFAQANKPTLIVTVSEAWKTVLAIPEETQVTNAPAGRSEIICVSVHSLLGTQLGECPVFDTPVRRCEYRPLVFQRVEGRMTMASLRDDDSPEQRH
ncbi:MAG: hypothetical protein Q7S87_10285 [Agitococcus sp.]|nr:hypothetical protein [Agitococcus sp.]MDO9177613.1 hypothetical protein [Agitococcus sp.]